MATEYGKRRAEIIAFLKGLDAREKLLALSYLGKDAEICAVAPNLHRLVYDMHRSHHQRDLLKAASVEQPVNLSLELLARRKGCQLERVVGPGDYWRIVFGPASFHMNKCGPGKSGLTRVQAMEALRALPD